MPGVQPSLFKGVAQLTKVELERKAKPIAHQGAEPCVGDSKTDASRNKFNYICGKRSQYFRSVSDSDGCSQASRMEGGGQSEGCLGKETMGTFQLIDVYVG